MADSIATLRPNATVVTGGFTTSSANLQTAVSDDNDSTSMSSHIYDEAVFDCTTFTLPALAQVRSVSLRTKARDNTGGSLGMEFIDVVNGVVYGNYYVAFEPSATSTVFTVATITPISTITQSAIDAFRVGIVPGDINNSATLTVLEVYLDVAYNQAPVVSSVAVDSTGNPTPIVSWTFTDPEADGQERFRVKIFTSAVVGGGGFDPETSTAVYDSGEVFSGAARHQTTTRLVSGTTYKVYVKAADIGSGGRFSNWASSSNDVVSYTVPTTPNTPAPTVTATSNLITVVTSGMGTNTPHLERSLDGGTTWVETRTGTLVAGTYTVLDYEAQSGFVFYRARASTTSGGFTLFSNYSAIASVTLTTTDWFLIDPTTPADNIVIGVKSHKIDVQENAGSFMPLGRSRTVVVGDTVRGEDGTIEIITNTNAEKESLKRQVNKQVALFLTTPDGDSWYVRFMSRSRERVNTGSYTRPLRTWTFKYVEVDAP